MYVDDGMSEENAMERAYMDSQEISSTGLDIQEKFHRQVWSVKRNCLDSQEKFLRESREISSTVKRNFFDSQEKFLRQVWTFKRNFFDRFGQSREISSTGLDSQEKFL